MILALFVDDGWIENDNNGIFVNQPQYTAKILKRFDFDFVNPVSTPMEGGNVH